jgi:hypothetical protein
MLQFQCFHYESIILPAIKLEIAFTDRYSYDIEIKLL